MQSLNDRMAGCTVFSKINLVKAFHQIPTAEEDIPKAVMATPFGPVGILVHDFWSQERGPGPPAALRQYLNGIRICVFLFR
jgi:hypothetical protein